MRRLGLLLVVSCVGYGLVAGGVYAGEVPLRDRIVETEALMAELNDELALRRHHLYERSVQVHALEGERAAVAKHTLQAEYADYDRRYGHYQSLRQDRDTLQAELDALY